MPPDTSAYYHAAYIAAAVLYVGYIVILFWRYRKVIRRLNQSGK